MGVVVWTWRLQARKAFPGQLVAGRYELVRRIGAGGMGEVWEAVQAGIQRRVAIKFLHPALMMHSTARRRVLKRGRSVGPESTTGGW